MKTQERVLAAAAAALAGFVDAIGFIEMGGFFVSFMSGNTTRLAIGLAGHAPAAIVAGGAIAAFLSGVVLGSLLGHAAGQRRKFAVLTMVAALLLLATLAGTSGGGLFAPFCMAMAMGAENATFEKDGDVRVGLTYMTGTLVKLGQRIAAIARGGPPFAWAPFLLQWLALAAGAVLGAALHPLLGLAALWFAAALAATLALASLGLRESA